MLQIPQTCLRLLLLSFFLINAAVLSAQKSKQPVTRLLPAVRTDKPIKIDGDISDSAWLTAPLATNFVEWRPRFGDVESAADRTEVKLLYDNTAIYISGFCHETRDSISTELVGRDVINSNDFVGVLFDTYHDKINGFGYYVTPLGEQFDAKYSNTGEDGSWNSVYESQAKIVSGGWTFEMRIPYSAIRFSTKDKQDWGINITRRRSKSGKQLMWNPTDPTFGGNFFAQFGLWTSITDIKPPVRLSFSPYFSTYVNNYPYNTPGIKNTSASVNGGMDLKYGINQSFTLDMTLIPDFGQVQSDNQVLNLTPFEVKYNETRTFFTEGTELFSKGNLFYSRRIGGMPIHYDDVYNELQPGESVAKNPQETRLINATKVSGRNASGLGIGFFNAITAPQYATIESGGKETRRIQTDPLTNYNILVLDQALKNNSSVSLINTNVTRAGKDYDANVTAALWDLYNKKTSWNYFGKVGVSQLLGFQPDGHSLSGYTHNIGFGKTGGNFNMSFSQDLADDHFNSNDMGYFTNNNYIDHTIWFGYKWLKPKGIYNNLYANFNGYYSMRYKPWDYQAMRINVNLNGQLKSLNYFGIFLTANAEQNDFYEPRVAGRVFKRPARQTFGPWFETNSAKKYSLSSEVDISRGAQYTFRGYDIMFRQQYRFNNKLTLGTTSNLSLYSNDVGFAMLRADSIFFGLRKRTTVENIFTVKYNFSNKMGLSFRARHYWSRVNNHSLYLLQPDGSLQSSPNYYPDANYNTNFFNIDMVYTWQFALGSFLNIVWKNAISTSDQYLDQPYLKNLDNTLSAPQLNSVSVRVLYFLDYLSLKKKK